MHAVRVHEFGGPEVLRFEEVPDPTAGPGQVVVGIAVADVLPRAGDHHVRHVEQLC